MSGGAGRYFRGRGAGRAGRRAATGGQWLALVGAEGARIAGGIAADLENAPVAIGLPGPEPV